MVKKGSLSIMSGSISPVIKKWLHSDHDIFYRELVSNGCDAITKLKKLELMGEYERPEDMEYRIQITVNPTDKTIKITDSGLDMAEEEIGKYISQIAFSGVQDFMSKYKDKASEDQITRHFGLGSYSAFMVADKVGIKSLPQQKDAKAVHWEPEGGIEFEMEEGDKASVGTTITLYLNEDSTKFCNEYRAKEVIGKYRIFIPVNTFLGNEMAEPRCETIEKDELTDRDKMIKATIEPTKTEEKGNEDGTKGTVEIEPSKEKYKILKRPAILDDTNPLQNKHPNERDEEDYKNFYRKVFRDYKKPLFQTHPNMGYPFNLKETLYFPKIDMEYDSLEGAVKLHNSQVFIADNIKEVIPGFLMLLKGVIDCSGLPPNVSRSALQNDDFVKKISNHVTKKAANKLSGMCKTDHENYEKYWGDIASFIRPGYIKDEKFAEKMGDFILYKNLDGKHLTLQGCLDENKEKHEDTVFYVTNEKEWSQYINVSKEEEIDVVIVPTATDSPFISRVGQKKGDLKFLYIDTDLNAAFKGGIKEDDEEFKETSEELSELSKRAPDNDKPGIRVEKMKNAGVASMITVSEDARRMQGIMKMYDIGGMDMGTFDGTGETLVFNANHPLVQYVLSHKGGGNIGGICEQLYGLASLSHGALLPKRITKFVGHNNKIMMIVAGEKAE